MSKKKHHNGKRTRQETGELDILGYNSFFYPPEDGDWAQWNIQNNIRFASDVTADDYQILRDLLLRGSGYFLNDITKEPETSSDPDPLGYGLSLNEYKWYRAYDDERQYTYNYKNRKRYIEDYSQYIQRREVTNLDKFMVPIDEPHYRRMTLFYGIQLFDEAGNLVFAAVMYKDSAERHTLVKQWFVDASKRLPISNIIPSDAILRTKTTVYLSNYPGFTVCSKTDSLNIRSFTNKDGDVIAVPKSLPLRENQSQK